MTEELPPDLLDDLRAIRISLTPGGRMLISKIPPLRKQLRILKEIEREIIRLRKSSTPAIQPRKWFE